MRNVILFLTNTLAENHFLSGLGTEAFHQLLVLLMCMKHMPLSSSHQIFVIVCNSTFHNYAYGHG